MEGRGIDPRGRANTQDLKIVENEGTALLCKPLDLPAALSHVKWWFLFK